LDRYPPSPPIRPWDAAGSRAVGRLPPAADQHAPGVGMGDHRRMYQQFVIDVLVDFGRLNLPVDHQAAAQVVELLNHHVLIGSLRADDDLPTALAVDLGIGITVVDPKTCE